VLLEVQEELVVVLREDLGTVGTLEDLGALVLPKKEKIRNGCIQ
jgi:hypothetical protein